MRVPLQLTPGLVSDDTTFSTVGLWEDGSNVRFWRGAPQTIGGWSTAFSDTLTGKCRGVHGWTDNSGQINIAFGTHTNLQVFAEGALFDITPVTLPVGAEDTGPGTGYGAGPYNDGTYDTPSSSALARTWTFGNWGEGLLASPRGFGIYEWFNDTGADAVLNANAPENITCILVTPQRQVLAFGCNEEISGVFNPLCIRGSDLENRDDWTTAPSNNAFEHILPGAGNIVAAKMLGPYVAVWTDSAVYIGQFVGQPGQAYRWDRVEDNCGLVSAGAVAIIDQRAYWIGTDYQFRVWSMGSVPQIIPCPIRNDMKDNIASDQAAKIAATTVSQFGEVWWFYPDNRDDGENSRYVALSTIDGSWFRGKMARTAAMDANVTQYPVMVDASGNVFYHELGKTANGGELSWFIKTADQYLGNGDTTFMMRGIWPDFEDQEGPVHLTIETRLYPQDESKTHGPYALAANRSKRDFRASARIASLKISGASSPSFARIGKPVFDLVQAGMR